MHKKLSALFAAVAIAGAMLVPTVAQAAGNSEQVTLAVTVNATCALSVISPSTFDFGARNAGTTTDQEAAYSYSVTSNVQSDIDVSAAGIVGAGGVQFHIRRGESTASYTAVPATAGIVSAGFRSSIPSGVNNFNDDARVVVNTTAAPGSRTQVLTYTTTCS